MQLQQTLLNLLVNAMDATEHVPPARRAISVSTATTDDGGVAHLRSWYRIASVAGARGFSAVFHDKRARSRPRPFYLHVDRKASWRHAFASKQCERGASAVFGFRRLWIEVTFAAVGCVSDGRRGLHNLLVDDDPAVLRSMTRLLRAGGYKTKSFSSPQKFLSAHDPSVPGCAIIDLVMSELDGLRLQEALAQSGSQRPIIFLTGRGDVSTSVRAMKAGAVDFLTKPVKRDALFSAVVHAAELDAASRQKRQEFKSIDDQLATLTHREREVLAYVIAGQLNKQIAASLGTVEKTIKVHRGRMMAKLRVRSVAELVRLADRAGIAPVRSDP